MCVCVHVCMHLRAPEEKVQKVLQEQTVLVTKDIRDNNQTAEHWQTGIFLH